MAPKLLPRAKVAEVARRYQLPVMYDVFGRPYLIEMIASQYPDVNFIVPHLAALPTIWRGPPSGDRPTQAATQRLCRHIRRQTF